MTYTNGRNTDGVGKSTIVTSLIKESFVSHASEEICASKRSPEQNLGLCRCSMSCRRLPYHQKSHQRTLRRISLTPAVRDLQPRILTFDRQSCLLIAGSNDRAHLESEIRKAHVICVVYSIDQPNSFDRIPTFWLPHFRQLGVNVCCCSCKRGFDTC
jgi:mitochondrial Rho GTPase 1